MGDCDLCNAEQGSIPVQINSITLLICKKCHHWRKYFKKLRESES